MVLNEFAVPLETKINYPPAKGGPAQDARNITLYAPSVRSLRIVAPVKQAFMKAMMSSAGDNELSEDEKKKVKAARKKRKDSKKAKKTANTVPKNEPGEDAMDAETILTVIMASNDIDYADFLESVVEILKTFELARIDGEAQVTDSFLDQLPLEELENIAGEYLANFITPSALRG